MAGAAQASIGDGLATDLLEDEIGCPLLMIGMARPSKGGVAALVVFIAGRR
jgi:hypothetical protein